MSLTEALVEHLKRWGLRRFETDAAYFQWQRETLAPADITTLNSLAERKRSAANAPAERAFYDFTAQPHIVPVLYSQRYDYYMAVGAAVAERIGDARVVLDFGCGVGILTTFYAAQFPDRSFIGVDRSRASVAAARERAVALGVKNIRFEEMDVEQGAVSGHYDLVVATHALLQAEQDPGIPSVSWRTFERPQDPGAQSDFERRTGLSARLDALRRVLVPNGRFLAFEKTRQLARRVPFQRALAARGFRLLEPPGPLRYRLVEEVVDDGPLYALSISRDSGGLGWDESPEVVPGEALYRGTGEAARWIWSRLPARVLEREDRRELSGRGAVRAERGTAAGVLRYWLLSIDERFRGIVVTLHGADEAGRFDRMIEEALADSERLVQLVDAVWPPDSQQDPATTPLYENHAASAQEVWESLPDRAVQRQATYEEPDGRQRHIELGAAGGLIFLYWANTFDQRQLVLVEPQRAALLEAYYDESCGSS
jgi:tRNA G46 methylase TrmB